jgi:hypothetical protein
MDFHFDVIFGENCEIVVSDIILVSMLQNFFGSSLCDSS